MRAKTFNIMILSPEYVNGYIQAQGLFDIKFKATKRILEVRIIFSIYQGSGSEDDMFSLATFFNEDDTYAQPRGQRHELAYETQNRDHLLDVVGVHFDNHPLRSLKQKDFLLFKRALKITEKKRLLMTDKEGELLTKDELKKLVDIAYAMNIQFNTNSYINNQSRRLPKDHWLKKIDSLYF